MAVEKLSEARQSILRFRLCLYLSPPRFLSLAMALSRTRTHLTLSNLDHRVNLKYSLGDVMEGGDSLNAMMQNLQQFFSIEELMGDVEESEAEEKQVQ